MIQFVMAQESTMTSIKFTVGELAGDLVLLGENKRILGKLAKDGLTIPPMLAAFLYLINIVSFGVNSIHVARSCPVAPNDIGLFHQIGPSGSRKEILLIDVMDRCESCVLPNCSRGFQVPDPK